MRRTTRSSTPTGDLKSAAQSYQESFVASADPLVKVFSEVGAAVSGAVGKVRRKLSRD